MRIRALVQARLGSGRLPAKVMAEIGGKTILEHIADRLQKLAGMGVETLFALAAEQDTSLQTFLQERGHQFITGDEKNVLKRYVNGATDLDSKDLVVRVTGDNPFVDQSQLGALLLRMTDFGYDYGHTADLPLGMGSEVIRVDALRSIFFRSVPASPDEPSPILPHHEEHVTTFIRENPHLYNIYSMRLDDSVSSEAAKLRVAGLRMTIDEPEDLAVARRVFEHFNRLGNPLFGALDVIQLGKNNPDMVAGNGHIRQNSATSVDARRNA
jgi:spore coat polysaccharide biosynthesis protein SpsF